MLFLAVFCGCWNVFALAAAAATTTAAAVVVAAAAAASVSVFLVASFPYRFNNFFFRSRFLMKVFAVLSEKWSPFSRRLLDSFFGPGNGGLGSVVRSPFWQWNATSGNGVGGGGGEDAFSVEKRTSVLFVSVSFIVLMVVSLAWLIFYYVQVFNFKLFPLYRYVECITVIKIVLLLALPLPTRQGPSWAPPLLSGQARPLHHQHLRPKTRRPGDEGLLRDMRRVHRDVQGGRCGQDTAVQAPGWNKNTVILLFMFYCFVCSSIWHFFSFSVPQELHRPMAAGEADLPDVQDGHIEALRPGRRVLLLLPLLLRPFAGWRRRRRGQGGRKTQPGCSCQKRGGGGGGRGRSRRGAAEDRSSRAAHCLKMVEKETS